MNLIYFVKFIYNNFLLPPGLFIILLLLLALRLFRKQSQAAKILLGLTFFFYLSTTLWLGDFLIHSLEKDYNPPAQIQGDVIIMLGGGATLDTPNTFGKGHLSGSAANRLLTCLQLYQRLQIPIIVSGGQVFKDTGKEAEIAKNILLELGIPEDKILIENQSLNTTENALYTQKILQQCGYQQPILVTSAFHMNRSVKQFAKAGIKVLPYPTDYRTNLTNNFNLRELNSSAEGLNKVSIALKEYLGLWALKWY